MPDNVVRDKGADFQALQTQGVRVSGSQAGGDGTGNPVAP
jgi:hypothetical protein